jgi:class 6 POU domain transcription factor
MMSEMTPQYLELKAFAEEFKTKRIRLGYTQGAVGQSLADKGYNNFAQSTISRFEQLQLSPTNAAAIKQVLEKWLHETECPESQSSSSVSSNSASIAYMTNRKRKKRAVFTTQTRTSLDEFFQQNPRPNRQLIESMANQLGLLPEEVRVWFCNKRQKSKHPQQVAFHYSYESEGNFSQISSSANSPSSPCDVSLRGRSSSPKTPFTIEELSKSSTSTTTTVPTLSTSSILSQLSSMVQPFTTPSVFPVAMKPVTNSNTTLPAFLAPSHTVQTTA